MYFPTASLSNLATPLSSVVKLYSLAFPLPSINFRQIVLSAKSEKSRATKQTVNSSVKLSKSFPTRIIGDALLITLTLNSKSLEA